ncbi:MAG: hypothetical protein M3N14_07465, partial [Bacteroidota bacterium]|nr:hypothetical protein [Bacteroidota bacterium]
MNSIFRKAVYAILTFLMDREKLLFLLSNKEERALIGFKREGYLYDVGWTNSIISDNIVDQSNNPIPWITYPFIEFIEHRLCNTFEIFEFGSGNSTLYYAAKTANVDSVENDEFWYNKIKTSMPQNVRLFYCELEPGGDYSKYVQKTVKKYDIIIVDGQDRVNCCINSIAALKPGGVIVLDDSERIEYEPSINFLMDNGFKKIDFNGIAPAINYEKCTTVFY